MTMRRWIPRLAAAAALLLVLILFSATELDFVYTGF